MEEKKKILIGVNAPKEPLKESWAEKRKRIDEKKEKKERAKVTRETKKEVKNGNQSSLEQFFAVTNPKTKKRKKNGLGRSKQKKMK